MKPSYNTKRGLAVAAIASLSLLGCGSSGDDTAPSFTRAELTQQVNQICAKRMDEKEEILSSSLKKLSQTGAAPSDGQVEDLVQSLLPPFQHMSEELGQLPASEKDAEALDDFTAELETGIERAEDDPARFAKADPFEAASEVALNHGFKACSL
jgi:hypothetical protein